MSLAGFAMLWVALPRARTFAVVSGLAHAAMVRAARILPASVCVRSKQLVRKQGPEPARCHAARSHTAGRACNRRPGNTRVARHRAAVTANHTPHRAVWRDPGT